MAYVGGAYLVLLKPLLEQLLPALLENGPRELHGLEVVELALLKENTKVLQNGGKTTRGRGCCLEGLDDLSRPEDALCEPQCAARGA